MTTPFPFVAGAVLQASQLNAITTLPINDQTASYTLVVGDVGKRVIMNVATANTVTVDDSIFAAGDTVEVLNKGAGATTLTPGRA
jgi:archaellum component FlaG (FlaF/FlaG flagellin family)